MPQNAKVCNIGIGAGEWDIYLSYKLPYGTLTSIDKLEICCRQLEERLICEDNPNEVKVICADAMTLDLTEKFDFLTIVGSTAMESGNTSALLAKASEFVKVGGAIYYQSLDESEDCNVIMQTAFRCGMSLAAYAEDYAYGICSHYYKFEKQNER